MCADDLSASTHLPKQPVPKGTTRLLPCLFCLFNLLTVQHPLRRCAQVLSLPHWLPAWLPLRALLNDEALGSKLWYVERKPKLTAGGGIKERHCPFVPHPKCHPFLVLAGQEFRMKTWAHIWKFLTGVMGAGTEWPGVMQLDVTEAEPSRLAPGHAKFGVCQSQSLSCPDSRMVTTNGQSQWEVFRKLKNFLSWEVLLPGHNDTGSGT